MTRFSIAASSTLDNFAAVEYNHFGNAFGVASPMPVFATLAAMLAGSEASPACLITLPAWVTTGSFAICPAV